MPRGGWDRRWWLVGWGTFSRWPTEMASIAEQILGGKGGSKEVALCCLSQPRGVVIRTSSKMRFSPFSVVTVTRPLFRSGGVWTLTTFSSKRMSAFSSGNLAILSKMASYVVSMKVSSGRDQVPCTRVGFGCLLTSATTLFHPGESQALPCDWMSDIGTPHLTHAQDQLLISDPVGELLLHSGCDVVVQTGGCRDRLFIILTVFECFFYDLPEQG